MNTVNSSSYKRILIAGSFGGTHLASSFERAARRMNLKVSTFDATTYYSFSLFRRIISRFLGIRTLRTIQKDAVHKLEQLIREFRPEVFVSFGALELRESTSSLLKEFAVKSGVFFSDDPWNRDTRHRIELDQITYADRIFTPRHANESQLSGVFGDKVNYLPFAFDESLFFADAAVIPDCGSDVCFVGGCDQDRIPSLQKIIDNTASLIIYGGNWQKHAAFQPFAKGMASVEVTRRATIESKVNLCLVRRANRDGHVMRTFEIAACGGCILAEDTTEHRDILGTEGENALYFSNESQMIEKLKLLLSDKSLRTKLRKNLLQHIQANQHTYTDRLHKILLTI